jgi:uncharacterized protein involved in response to NO
VTPEAGGIPRYRITSLPPLFSQGFRPFFLAAALWAPVSLCIWLAEFSGFVALPTNFVGSAWHAHEMIFGFATAAMAGYLMTAVPNWTGRMPLQGLPLAMLFGLWCAGRLATAVSAWIGAVAAAVLDLAFPTALILVICREIYVGRNWRNLPIIAAVSLLLLANAATHLGSIELWADGIGIGGRGGIAIFVGLISMVGGRVIPSFTRNRLAKSRLPQRPAAFAAFDRVALLSVAVSLTAWVAAMPSTITGPLLMLAGILSAARLARWQGWLVFDDPSLWILHLGFGWLAIGLLLLGGSELWPQIPAVAGLHAMGAGAIGSSIVGVMGRTTLAQTGRRASFVPGTSLIHALVTIAATLRVLATLPSDVSWMLLEGSAAAWTLAFVAFVALYGRALMKPKADRRQDAN